MKNHPSPIFSTFSLIFCLVLTPSLTRAANCPGPDSFGNSCADVSREYIPGVNDVGNHCDDCTTLVELPFTFTFYGTNYDEARVSSNGNLQFNSTNPTYSNTGLPRTDINDAILPYFDDLRTDKPGNGVFVKTAGTAPNRIFIIEWRTTYFSHNNEEALFEIQLEETTNDIYIVYGSTRDNGASATTGIQHASGDTYFLQYSYNQAILTNGKAVRYGVRDTVAPTVSCSANPDLLWAPNHKLVPVTVSVEVTDVGSGPNSVALVAAESSQTRSNMSASNTAGDIQGLQSLQLSDIDRNAATYTTTVYLRAERPGNQKEGRTYTLTYRGSDVDGNTADCVVTVKVPHDQKPPQ